MINQGNLYQRPPLIRKKTCSEFACELNIDRGNLDGKTARVLDAIVLIASAGRIAAQVRILPQGHVEIRQATRNVTRG